MVFKIIVVKLYCSKFVKFTTFMEVSVILNSILTIVYLNN